MADLDKAKLLCEAFRRGIDTAKAHREFNDDIPFRDFPIGCCGEASRMLSVYLLDHGVRSQYVCASYFDPETDGSSSHAWLGLEGDYIADITGDQFMYSQALGEYSEKCYVGPIDYFHGKLMSDIEVEEWLAPDPAWVKCPVFSKRMRIARRYADYELTLMYYSGEYNL